MPSVCLRVSLPKTRANRRRPKASICLLGTNKAWIEWAKEFLKAENYEIVRRIADADVTLFVNPTLGGIRRVRVYLRKEVVVIATKDPNASYVREIYERGYLSVFILSREISGEELLTIVREALKNPRKRKLSFSFPVTSEREKH